jgi:hypothetical protein
MECYAETVPSNFPIKGVGLTDFYLITLCAHGSRKLIGVPEIPRKQ